MSNGGAYFTNLKKYWRFYCYKIIWRHVFVTNGTSRVPLLCYSSHFGPFFQVLPDDHLEKRFSDQQDFTEFILWGIQILRRNILKTGKMVIICTRMRILDTFWLFLLVEPLGLYMSVLHVKWMYSFHPFEKIRKVYLPKNLQKLNKFLFWVLCWPFLAIFSGHVLVTNKPLRNPLWCFLFWDIRILRLANAQFRTFFVQNRTFFFCPKLHLFCPKLALG